MLNFSLQQPDVLGRNTYEYDADTLVRSLFAFQTLTTGKVLYSRTKSGKYVMSKEEIRKHLEEHNFRKIVDWSTNNVGAEIYMSNDANLVVSLERQHGVDYVQVFFDDESNFPFCNWALGLVEKETAASHSVFTLVQTSDGLSYRAIGDCSLDLIRGNYTDDVLGSLDYVSKELSAEVPFGRLVIIDGPPGSGKSFIIRGLMKGIENSLFLLIPPNMISQLGTPGFIPVLMDLKTEMASSQKHLILLLEDADDVLTKRMADNMSSISSLLNLCDGLSGSLFDVRMIATSNAHHTEYDSAIVRNGRLMRRINVLPHGKDKANEILQRLTGDKEAVMPLPQKQIGFNSRVEEKYTLADIYSRYNEVKNAVR